MEIKISQDQGAAIVQIVGRLDTVTAPELDQAVKPLIEPGAAVVFDCANMEYVSSSGLRVVLSTHKQLAALGGRFAVRNLNREVRSVFDLTGFSRLLTIE
ncbi:MAG: STAS domain-containing protein [Rikenellaceae bacterium]|nr:STAS domain-containing protein [Rikenellaceae bacterium]